MAAAAACSILSFFHEVFPMSHRVVWLLVLLALAAAIPQATYHRALKSLVERGVILVGETNVPALVAADASALYARNLLDFMKLIVSKDAEETIYSRNFDTFPCRVMQTPGGRKYTARKLSPPVAIGRSLAAARELNTPLSALARDALGQGLTGAAVDAFAAGVAHARDFEDAAAERSIRVENQVGDVAARVGEVRGVGGVEGLVSRVGLGGGPDDVPGE